MAQAKPSARGDIDYLTYLVYFEAQDVGLAGGTRSYGPWFQRFISRYGAAISNAPQLVIDAREQAQLDAWLAIKPCSNEVVTERAPWDTVNANRANFGETVTYFDAAASVACE